MNLDKLKNYRPKKNHVVILLLIFSFLVVMPHLQSSSFAEDVRDSDTVYRYDVLGASVERVVLDNGAVTYVKKYPWYHFHDVFSGNGMNIYGVSSPSATNDYSSSNQLYLTTHLYDSKIPITLKEQNDLMFQDTFGGFWDGKKEVHHSKLVMYEGWYEDTSVDLKESTHEYHDKTVSEGPYEYGEKWTDTVHLYPKPMPFSRTNQDRDIKSPGVYDFTIEETLYIDSVRGYDQDRAFITANILEDEDDSDSGDGTDDGKGTIVLKVLDNLLQSDSTVDMYKDSDLIRSDIKIDGKKEFNDLDYGTYWFRVIDDDFTTWNYDCIPHQSGYDLNTGKVELEPGRTQIGYQIFGISDERKESGESGFDGPDQRINWSNNTISQYIEGDKEDDQGTFGYLGELFIRILASAGLFAVLILGLPVFVILVFLFLIFILVSSDDDKNQGRRKQGSNQVNNNKGVGGK